MATILIVDDDAALRESLAETVTDLGHAALPAASGREALARLAEGPVAAVLLDLRMPGELDGMAVLARIRALADPPPVTVLTAFASPANTIEAMRLGAHDHLTKPIGRADLAATLARMLLRARPDGGATADPEPAGGLIGSSEGMRRVQKTIGLVADSPATVLIRGETGTGKEEVARALHAFSGRRARPCVPVNCAAIPADRLESELFGHVRGVGGALADRAGAFHQADGGTLFLDEVGDMPPAMQAKILRVIQDRVVTPLGGRPVQVDVRVIAATHRDLPALVAEGLFRADLYYRLNVVPIALPPLRERLADIVPLAEHFLGPSGRRLAAGAASRLLAYRWPGNVRELRNVVERAAVLARGGPIEAADLDLPDDLPEGDPAGGDTCTDICADLPGAVARLERTMIAAALAEAGGNRARAARRLGIQRQLLYAKMERYGLAGGLDSTVSGDPTTDVGNPDTPGVSGAN